METRSVTLRILGDDRDARAALDWVNARGDQINAKDVTMKIGADASGAMGKMAGLRAAVDTLTKAMNDIKFSATDTAFNATLASMLAKLTAFQAIANRPILSDKMLAQSKADVLSLAASFDKLVASQAAAGAAARAAAIDQAQLDATLRNEALDAMQLEAVQRNAAYDNAVSMQVARRDKSYDAGAAALPGFPIIGKPPGGGAGAFGLAASIPLFGGVAAVSGIHVLIDGAIELAAKLIPATVAAIAFGGALVALAPTANMIYQRETAMYTATDVLGQAFPMLTQRLGQWGQLLPATTTNLNTLNAEFRPGVVQLWGDALTVAAGGAGTLQKLLSEAVPWVDKFAAKLTVDLVDGSGAFMKFVQQGAHDLAQFGQFLGPIILGLANLFKIANQTGIANDLLAILTAGARLFDLITKLPTPILVAIAALHGMYVWGGLAVTGLEGIVAVIARLPGLGGLKVLSDIPALLDSMATKGLEATAGLDYVAVKGMRGLAIDASGAEVKTGLFKTALAALSTVPVWGWVAVGVIALGGLAYWLGRVEDSTHKWIDTLNKGIASASNASVFNLMAQDIGQVNAKLNQLPSGADAAKQALGGATSASRSFAETYVQSVGAVTSKQTAFSGENQKILGQMTNFATGAGWIMKTFGVSYPEAIAIATQAGVKLTSNMQGNSKAAQDLRQQIFGMMSGLTQLQGPSGMAGKDFEALAISSNDITTKIGQLNAAWHTMVTTVTGPQSSFDTFAQGLANLNSQTGNFTWRLGQLTVTGKNSKSALDSLTASGINLNQAFMQEVGNLDSYIGTLRTGGASQGQLTEAMKAGVGALIPFAAGSKEGTATLSLLAQEVNGPTTDSIKTLATWAGVKAPDALGIMKGETNQTTIAASNLANTLQNLLNVQFQNDIIASSGASAALGKYTTDLVHNQQTTQAGQTDRQNLINALIKAGDSAQTATNYVDGLSTALGKIPTKESPIIIMTGKGSYTISGSAATSVVSAGGIAGGPHAAAGWRVPGYGGGDKWPAMLEGGEAVVPKHLVAPIAPFLSANRVPGFETGGFVGSVPGLASFSTNMYGTFQNDMVNSMVSAMKTGIQQAQAAASSFGGLGPVSPASGSALAAQNYARSLLGSYGWSQAQMPPLILLWNQESGWNANAVNPSSGAYGIPQSLGHGHPYNLGDYRNQVIWGLNYIKSTYGSPASAWAHEVAHNWYDNGGFLPTGLSVAMNNTGRPELVTPLNRVPAHAGTSGGGGDIYITVNAGDVVDPYAVGQAIHQTLRRYKTNRGGMPLGLE